ncbi:hypothetical protein [Paenibacillus sp. NRS-1781]|uniref:hypothetical protein n=1 Tax=Paenibacillus sp. NRS-1781 TaxID=3233905 RepID=UPI003D2A3D17
MEYVRIEACSEQSVQRYLDGGWKIIDTAKSEYPGEGSQIIYHVGYPAAKRIEDLLNIIKDYEKHGFKERLFEIIATENEDDYTQYDRDGGVPTSDTAKYMSQYDSAVQNRNITYSKRHVPQEYHLRG